MSGLRPEEGPCGGHLHLPATLAQHGLPPRAGSSRVWERLWGLQVDVGVVRPASLQGVCVPPRLHFQAGVCDHRWPTSRGSSAPYSCGSHIPGLQTKQMRMAKQSPQDTGHSPDDAILPVMGTREDARRWDASDTSGQGGDCRYGLGVGKAVPGDTRACPPSGVTPPGGASNQLIS